MAAQTRDLWTRSGCILAILVSVALSPTSSFGSPATACFGKTPRVNNDFCGDGVCDFRNETDVVESPEYCVDCAGFGGICGDDVCDSSNEDASGIPGRDCDDCYDITNSCEAGPVEAAPASPTEGSGIFAPPASGLNDCQECRANIADYYNQFTSANDPAWQSYILACNLICLQVEVSTTFNRVAESMNTIKP